MTIANARILAGASGKSESAEKVSFIFQTNLIGLLNTTQTTIHHVGTNRNGYTATMSKTLCHLVYTATKILSILCQ